MLKVQANSASLAGTAALSLAVVAVGAATDKFGLRQVAIPVLLLLIFTTYGLYLGVERMPSVLLPLYILAGMGAGAAVLAPILIIRAFPPAVRFSGFSPFVAFVGVITVLLAPTAPASE